MICICREGYKETAETREGGKKIQCQGENQGLEQLNKILDMNSENQKKTKTPLQDWDKKYEG